MGGEPMPISLLLGLPPREEDLRVTGVAMDSRQVRSGDLFLAVPGVASDGRRFIAAAVAAGAAAVAVPDGIDAGDLVAAGSVPVFAVPELSAKVGEIAARFHHQPSCALRVLGVTGTNGKTSCSHHLAQMLEAMGERSGICGTLGYGFPGSLHGTGLTTPDAVTLQRALASMRDAGARWVAMEVSSHALDQGRVGGIEFEAALFTNLTRDHLDYHGDMDTYGEAKRRLFLTPGLEVAAVNVDDAFGARLAASIPGAVDVLGYAIGDAEAAVRARDPQFTPDGVHAVLTTPWGEAALEVPLLGRFSLSNVVGCIALLLGCGVALDDAVAAAARVRSVPGRMQCFPHPAGATIVVDYAHTPDALERALEALRDHFDGRVLCVFGCGGDRDRGKRPEMGRIAERGADQVIVTDDNPRTEDGDAIVGDILAGLERPSAAWVERDRRRAIGLALSRAGAGDVVLVAGKGHEDYQDGPAGRVPYSDLATVQELLVPAGGLVAAEGG